MKEHSHSLLMPFLDETENFCLGFECGEIWTKCDKEFEFEQYVVHTKNKEQIQMICAHFGYVSKIDFFSEDWSYLNATKFVGETIH